MNYLKKVFLFLLISASTGLLYGQKKTSIDNFFSPFKDDLKLTSKFEVVSPKDTIKPLFKKDEYSIKLFGTTLNASFFSKNSLTDSEFLKLLASFSKDSSSVSFSKFKDETDELGFRHLGFCQQYMGIKIYGAEVLVHYDNKGRLKSANGKYFNIVSAPTTPLININQTVEKAKSVISASRYMWEVPELESELKREKRDSLATYYPKPELIIFCGFNENIDTPILCYKLEVSCETPIESYKLFINAISGKLESKLKLNTDCVKPRAFEIINQQSETSIEKNKSERVLTDVISSANTLYSGTKSITTDNFNGIYRLRETARPIQTFNLRNSISFADAVDFNNSSSTWNTPDFVLDSVRVNSINSSWIDFPGGEDGGAPDLCLKIVRISNNYVLWKVADEQKRNEIPPTSFNTLGINFNNGPFQVYLFDIDGPNVFDTLFASTFFPQVGSNTITANGTSLTFYLRTRNSPALDVHWATEKAYDFFLSRFNRNSFDNAGAVIKSYVHVGKGYINAGWSGTLNLMAYGDGDGVEYSPLVALDVAGHELTHAVVQYSANLEYNGESGALNESFADIFGAAIEFVYGNTPNWNIGESCFLQTPNFLRSMSDPPSALDPQPDTYGGQHWIPTSGCTPTEENDKCGVHTNSGVQNKWFYLLSQGGSGINDNSNVYSVSGIGIIDASKIAYRNLTQYLTSTSNYYDAYVNSLQAAEDLFGNPSNQYTAVKQAWFAVGIGDNPNSYCNTTTTLTSSSGIISDGSGIANYTNGTNCKWIIKPAGATRVTLAFTQFNTEPNYDTLFVYNGPDDTYPLLMTHWGNTLPPSVSTSLGVGAMCIKFKTDQTINAAGWLANYTSTGITPTCSGGTVFNSYSGNISDGSGNSNYGNNQLCHWIIAPPCASSVTLSFSSFSTELNYDGVVVYDGITTNSNVLGVFSGNSIPTPITSTTGKMLVVFISDYSNTSQGFSASYTATGVPFCATSNQLFNSDYGYITDGSGTSSYCNNTSCQWLIQPPQATSVTLNFTEFDLEGASPDGNTVYDVVEVYDGTTTTSPLLGRFYGNQVPSSITSSSGAMLVVFRTDLTVTKNGWAAYYTSTQTPHCTGGNILTAQTGTITDGSGSNNYSNNSDCSWLIQVPGALGIRMSFSEFSTELDYDELIIFDGPNDNSPVLARLSGGIMPPNLTSTSSSVFLRFVSDISIRDNGFMLNYNSIFFRPSITPASDTSICLGQSLAITGPSGYSAYQWSSGQTTQSISVTQSGSYSVRVLLSTGSFSSWSDTVNVTIDSPVLIPTISRSISSNACVGQTLSLSSSTASAYQWYRNDTLIQSAINQTYQPNVNAAYRVRVFSPNRACSSQSDTVMVNLLGLNVTGVILQDTIKACGVDSVTLDAGSGYGNYQWSNGANTRTIRVGTSGKYTVQVTCGPNVYNSGYFSTVSTGSPRPSASIPNASQYSFTNNMTIIYRLRVENVPNGANVVLQKGEGSSFQFSIPSWPFLKFTYPGIGKPNGLNAQISQWNWVWVAVVKTPDSVFLYVNNVIADRAASPNPIPVTTSPIIIGKAQEWDYFSGSVDQLSFWNRSLTGAEISNYQNCMIGTESGCVGFYNFDQTITATIPDFSTFGNTAINNGRVIGYGSPFLTCQGTVISDSVYVSIIKTGIAQNDTSICRSSTLTLATTNATSAATNICTTAQLSTNLRNGVVAFYPFCGSVNDVSGNGFNGSNSGATFINDRLGNAGSAMDFNGINANISLPTNINNSISNELTLGMWVYLRAIPDANHRYLFYSGNGEWGLNYDNSTIYFSVKLSDGTWWSAGAATATYLNRWTYFTCQYKKGAFVKLFADGNLLNQQVIPNLELSKPNLPSFIGSVYGNLRYANASIDNVILHNRILSNSEISSFTSPAETYTWSTGSTASSISVTPTQSTTYYLTTSDGIASCTDSVRVTIATVDTAVAVLDPLSICTGSGQVRLQAALGLSYQWLRNGVPISGATSRTYTATQAGQYRVALSNSIACRDTSRIVTVIENPKPLAAFTTNVANQCLSGNLYNFTNTSSISSGTLSYLWSFGDGNTATTSNATYSYTTAGSYTVKLVVTSSLGCKDSTIRSVTVFPKPAVDFTVNSLSQCVNGNSFVFTNNSTISTGTITYIWRFGDGNSASTTNASYTYTLPGTYVVKLIATSNNGCSDSTTRTVMVNPKPTVDFSINNPAQCLSVNQFVFTNNSTISAGTLSHTWDFGNGAFSLLSSPTYTYANPGSFTVKLVSTSAAGCKDSISRQVTVHPMPTGVLSTPSTNLLCEGGNLLLSASGGNTYQWFLNGGAIPGAVNATHSATQPGVYTVNVISSNGCVSPATGSVTLQLVVRPTVNFVYDKYCAGFPTLFANQSNTSNSNIVSYSWSFGQGQATSTLQSPSYTFSTAGVYNVSLTVTPLACPSLAASLSKPVTIVPPPPNQRYTALNAVENRDLQLDARSSGGANYIWSPPSGLSNPAIPNPIFNYNAEVDYIVTITTGIGCIIKDTQLVRIFKEKEIYVPKGFSPNADGNNDKIFPRLVGVRTLSYFKVYNRWGQLLYQTSNPDEGWDGTFRGVKQPMETYVWMAEGIDIDNNTIRRTGNFLLLR